MNIVKFDSNSVKTIYKKVQQNNNPISKRKMWVPRLTAKNHNEISEVDFETLKQDFEYPNYGKL